MRHALLHRIAVLHTYMQPVVTNPVGGLSVYQSVCSVTLVSPAETAEAIELPFVLSTQVGSRNHVLQGVQIPHEKDQFWGANWRTIVKYRDTLRSSVQKQLNRSRCHLGCGLVWFQGICVRWESRSLHGKGQFWWIGAPIVRYRHFYPWPVQKWLNR